MGDDASEVPCGANATPIAEPATASGGAHHHRFNAIVVSILVRHASIELLHWLNPG